MYLDKERAEKAMTDFEEGYYYAKQRNEELVEKSTLSELLELAEVFNEVVGENAELARGMAAYYIEMARGSE
ncbi:MAG: hypothetical protein H6Q73_3884 [Firmicutes bacterium]|nr:hypothetical protein [Bacillota bacterium]